MSRDSAQVTCPQNVHTWKPRFTQLEFASQEVVIGSKILAFYCSIFLTVMLLLGVLENSLITKKLEQSYTCFGKQLDDGKAREITSNL